jgi:uncharacterized protein
LVRLGGVRLGRCYHPCVIVDFHTHVFPPDVISARDRWCEEDALFRSLYSDPRAKLASADDLLASMDRSGIDFAVILGFAWSTLDACIAQNDYLLEAADRSGGRLVPFCTVQPRPSPKRALAEIERCARAGARGLGELRPEDQGYDLASEAGGVLALAAARHDLIVLFHVSEPVGHTYAGKQGLALADFARFVKANPGVRTVGAHWGGGLPFFALMPEVRSELAQTWFDTAASRFLYDGNVFSTVAALTGPEKVLFGSDFPLVGQKQARQDVEAAGLEAGTTAAILGGNAAELLGLH